MQVEAVWDGRTHINHRKDKFIELPCVIFYVTLLTFLISEMKYENSQTKYNPMKKILL